MQGMRQLTLILILAAPLGPVVHAAPESGSPVGLWKTVDDRTGAAKAIVRISFHDGVYSARIEQSFDPQDASQVCELCTGDRKNQPIIGLEVIRGMTRRDDEYAGGEILDPETGSVYRCRFRLQDGGRKLLVRGFAGVALLGRTQVWIREP